MKLCKFFLAPKRLSQLFAALATAGGLAQAQTTPFTFTLDEPSTTSAGVFAGDGTLIRTLWSKVNYAAGSNSATWDGLDDNSHPVAAGTYAIKVLQHNTEYVWDGAIGNTSDNLSGPTVHNGFYPMRDMAIARTNGYYVSGYNEGGYDFRGFYTTDPQQVVARWGADNQPANIYDRNWKWVATDGIWVYFACSAATNPQNTATNNYPGFIVASQVGNVNPAYSANFSQGVPIVNGANTNSTYPNGIYVGTQSGLDGLAVQQTGNLLAAAVAPDNTVYLLDKRAGSPITNFNVPAPGRMSFSSDGSLWVVSGTSVICFTNLTAAPTRALTISNFTEPLAVAVNPANANLILVADGGSSQQIKAFDSMGAPLWTYGLAGGYQTNGVAVQTNKFWFNDGEVDGTFLCFAADSSFWVGDGGNYRALHFSPSLQYLEQIMYQPHSYMTCVDPNNPSRVINQFLEFSVDYSKPLPQAWTLVNNWKVGVDPIHISWNQGLYEVTTFTNGRVYALIDNNTYAFPLSELCELTAPQLRFTGIFPAYSPTRGWISLGPDGSARNTTIGAANWFEAALSGFDASNNPVWNPLVPLASAPGGSTDPVPRGSSFGNIRATISSNNILISFDQSLNNGWHLGGIQAGGSNWLWRASPAVAWMNGCGTYEISNGVQYAGNTVQAVDRNVIYGYHGEFFRGAGQAGQIMHFYDDGLFVGQFGECNIGHSAYEGAVPASAGNAHCPNLVKTASGGYYVWVNDESGHGPQRWHLANAGNIREQIGSGPLGTAIILTNQSVGFPCAVTGQCGNQTAALSWLPVPGANGYNVRYSLINGGPYNDVVAGFTTNTSCVVGGLTNGQTYYFVVMAIQAGAAGGPSEQVHVTPFDTTQNVLCAGSMAEGGQQTPVIDVCSTTSGAGQCSFMGAEHMTGVLTLRNLNEFGYGNLQYQSVGAQGYYIFDPQGPATSAPNLSAPVTLTFGSGWYDVAYLERQYRMDSSLASNHGMVAMPCCALNLSPGDTNYHVLTVVSPAQFNNPRQFTMRLVSTNNSSASFTVNEPYGYSHTFQYLFKGNVILWADSTGGAGAMVQSLFLDNAPVTYAAPNSSSPALVPPTQFRVGL
jgi:hypothetical protein